MAVTPKGGKVDFTGMCIQWVALLREVGLECVLQVAHLLGLILLLVIQMCGAVDRCSGKEQLGMCFALRPIRGGQCQAHSCCQILPGLDSSL